MDTSGRPLRTIITEGSHADCKQACALIAVLQAKHLLADRGYDTDQVLGQAQDQKMNTIIPAMKTRKLQRPYDKEQYKLRHQVENAFLQLKRWRGIATRYAKRASSFLAAIQIRCIALWASIF